MMIARKLAIEELHMEEPALPFDDLDDNFFAGDSLITFPENDGAPLKTPWPAADVITSGNSASALHCPRRATASGSGRGAAGTGRGDTSTPAGTSPASASRGSTR
jgi:hypothetical protein